jgi:hypothetical protein
MGLFCHLHITLCSPSGSAPTPAYVSRDPNSQTSAVIPLDKGRLPWWMGRGWRQSLDQLGPAVEQGSEPSVQHPAEPPGDARLHSADARQACLQHRNEKVVLSTQG